MPLGDLRTQLLYPSAAWTSVTAAEVHAVAAEEGTLGDHADAELEDVCGTLLKRRVVW